MKPPSLSCPKYVCAQIRKHLKRAGLPLSKTTGRYSPFGEPQTTTAGYRVSKVGCSKNIAVSYTHGGWIYGNAPTTKPEMATVIRLLRDLGYPISDAGWIHCDHHDEMDS